MKDNEEFNGYPANVLFSTFLGKTMVSIGKDLDLSSGQVSKLVMSFMQREGFAQGVLRPTLNMKLDNEIMNSIRKGLNP